jgi:hypothetical protein
MTPAPSVTPPPPAADDAGRPGLFGLLVSALRYLVRRAPDETVDIDAVPPESAWRAPTREERYTRAEAAARENFQPPYDQGDFYSSRPDQMRTDPDEDRYSASPASYRPQSPTAGEARQSPADQQDQIDEIRASLREFREAVRELTESRARRYF